MVVMLSLGLLVPKSSWFVKNSWLKIPRSSSCTPTFLFIFSLLSLFVVSDELFAQTISDFQQKSVTIYQARFESALEKFSHGYTAEAIQEMSDLFEDTRSPRVQLELARFFILMAKIQLQKIYFRRY
jgi:hypothetical protein